MKTLDEILEDKFQHARPSTKICQYSLKYEEATSAIIELVKGCVPEKQEVVGDILDKYCQGHNYCRQQMLDNLERL